MIKIYFRQAIQLLLQNKLMSVIAILGTALAITMIMSIIVSEEIKNIDVSPESNRSRSLFIGTEMTWNNSGGGQSTQPPSLDIVDRYIKRLQIPQYVSAVSTNFGGLTSMVQAQGSDEDVDAVVRVTDGAYWKIMSFDFIEGRPFTEEEFQSGMAYAVITESTARTLFNNVEALGKTIEVELKPYHVIGIVKDVSPLFQYAYSDVWMPYTSSDEYKEEAFEVIILAAGKDDFDAIWNEARDIEKQYVIENEGAKLFLKGPETSRQYNTSEYWAASPDEVKSHISTQQRKKILIFAILLLIPAINLSGISLSRIRKRTAEIGVRKAFGAKKYVILTQVLYENLITSLLGGVLGLVMSYAVVFWLRDWLLNMPGDGVVPLNTLVSPYVFLAVLVICVLMNLLSAGLPAWKASRMVIVNSLNQNDQKA